MILASPKPVRGRKVRASLRRLPLAHAVRRTALAGVDGVEAALGRRDPLRPPRRLQGVGAGDYAAVGSAIVRQLAEIGGLEPGARVLDIGCGTGRVAVPLAQGLEPRSYDGFDVNPRAVGWCEAALTPRFPRLRFRAIDIANSHYNPRGSLDASAVTFPYADRAFDFAFAASLFTHLLPPGFLNYVAEVSRVLAPSGTFFGTFFLINPRSAAALRQGTATLDLPHRVRDTVTRIEYQTMDRASPETAIALEEDAVVGALEEAGLVVHSVHHGRWARGELESSYQDILVARRAIA